MTHLTLARRLDERRKRYVTELTVKATAGPPVTVALTKDDAKLLLRAIADILSEPTLRYKP